MSRIGINIDGIEKTVKKLQSYGEEGDKQIRELTEIKARDIEINAKEVVPVGTPESTGIRGYIGGSLRQSIRAEKLSELSWIITAYEFYASFVEYGTRKMTARPYLFPAWKRGIISYRKDLKKALDRLAKKYNK